MRARRRACEATAAARSGRADRARRPPRAAGEAGCAPLTTEREVVVGLEREQQPSVQSADRRTERQAAPARRAADAERDAARIRAGAGAARGARAARRPPRHRGRRAAPRGRRAPPARRRRAPRPRPRPPRPPGSTAPSSPATSTSAVVRPEPGRPATSSPPLGRQASGGCACSSGASTRPSTRLPGTAASPWRSSRSGSGSSHGRRGARPGRALLRATTIASGSTRATVIGRGRSPATASTAAPGSSAARRRPPCRPRRAVGRVEHAQRDAQPAVRGELVADAARRPLRAEHEVHAERSAARRDVGEDRGERGRASSSARNSSTTTTRRGSPVPATSATAASRSTCSRRRSSAASDCTARSVPAASRSVTIPATCGRWATGSNAAPPLWSTSRSTSRSGGCADASARTHAVSSALLPLPVVPATIACGPSGDEVDLERLAVLEREPGGEADVRGRVRRERGDRGDVHRPWQRRRR